MHSLKLPTTQGEICRTSQWLWSWMGGVWERKVKVFLKLFFGDTMWHEEFFSCFLDLCKIQEINELQRNNCILNK